MTGPPPPPEPHAIEPPEPATNALLILERMESALVRAQLEHPDESSPDDVRRLRYIIRLAHVTDFQPGAAKAGKRLPDREDIALRLELDEFRGHVLDTLRRPLRAEHNSLERLRRAQASLATLAPIADHVRRELADRHADQLTLAELDGELERKALVNVAGGGGGSGYVYIGAYLRLHEAGIRPAFVVGASMGAVIGLFDARAAVPPWDQYLVVAHTLAARELFAPPTRHRRYGLPGLIRLHLATTFGSMFTGEDGEPMRIRDVEVPYEAVVAGVRRRSYERLPQRFRRAPGAGRNRLALASAVAARMWQVALFFDPRVVKPVLLGADAQTVGLRAYDAAGFAAAIPGVLHYDVLEPDPETELALDGLFEREELAALVDGGVTANVPAALAWNRVRDGKLGTRNAFTLAFDSFHPQWDPRHLWLQPITQAIALQQARDARYADWTIRFEPTLSPVTLVPSPETVDHAIEWGRNSVDPLIPMLQRSLEPVWWDAPSPGG